MKRILSNSLFFVLMLTATATTAYPIEKNNTESNKPADGSEKHYTYCYAVDYGEKELVVSDIISCYFSDVSYAKTTIAKKNAAKSSLEVEWLKKANATLDDVDGKNVMYWTDSFNEVDENRDDIISMYRKEGYSVRNVTVDFDCND